MHTAGLLKKREAAGYLGVSTKTLERRVTERRIGVIRLGDRIIRFKREDLDAYIASNREQARN